MSKLRGLGVAAVFLVGCAVGGASSRLAVRPASAQQGAQQPPAQQLPPPPLPRWEHQCVRVSTIEEMNGIADLRGREYWELAAAAVGPGGAFLCFKRPRLGPT